MIIKNKPFQRCPLESMKILKTFCYIEMQLTKLIIILLGHMASQITPTKLAPFSKQFYLFSMQQ
jgi:hypothetical protein